VVIPGDQAEFAFVRALQMVEIKFLILFIRCTVLAVICKQQQRHANSVDLQRINKHGTFHMFRR